MSLVASLRSEYFKTKRTAPLYFTLAAAAFGPFMSTLDLIFDGVEADHRKDIFNEIFTTKFMMTGAVVLPWFMILVCTLLAQVEYKNNTWKQVLASPQSKGSIFLAKFINVQLLIVVFLITNQLLMLVSAIILHFREPSLNVLNQPLNGNAILATVSDSYVALLAICAIQFWLGLKFKNFITPIAIGIGCWFMGSLLVMQMKTGIPEYFPYSFHIYASFSDFKPRSLDAIHLTSIAFASAFLLIGYVDFAKRTKR